MIVDGEGRFLSQREQPKLATVSAAIEGANLVLSAAHSQIAVATPAADAPRVAVTLWKQQVEGHAAPAEADAWLRDFLGIPCRLVWQGGLPREVAPKYSAPGTHASYADGFPLLVTVVESLDDLNRRMAAPLPMNRFRPNIVIAGALPWAEDGWKRLRIGSVEIEIAKPCTRCIVTTTDQRTGARDGGEPLKTLKAFRLLRGPDLTGVVFGQNAVPNGTGVLKAGDAVEVIGTQKPPAFGAIK